MIQNRLVSLRQEMAKRNIAMYIIPTADFHESEYVGEYFKARQYITGFTGSAGVAIITQEEAGLWTDGRYFVQAQQQLKETGIELYRKGEENVLSENEFVEKTLGTGETLGFDGRAINHRWGKKLEEIVRKKNGSLSVNEDLVDVIWKDRPLLSAEPVELLDLKYTGESTLEKLKRIREQMNQKAVDVHLVSSLCDIAWILNVRGNDITYVPVVLSYMAILQDSCIWFVQEQILTDEIRAYLRECGIVTQQYDAFYQYVERISNQTVWLDSSAMNYRICSSIADDVKVIDEPAASVPMKAVKNETQMQNIKNAHLKDAVAMCRFMYWLKTNIGKGEMTEMSAVQYLLELREKQEGFLSLSFETICGYAEHGAIVHYAVKEESDAALKPEGFLLVDSGGHYLEGTTDVTRTFALGKLTRQMKEDFTRVCRANINLANARFRYGCTGLNLDVIAREPLWEAGLDYNHGTGHGVGYLLNVHEEPNAFRWRQLKDSEPACILEEGMVTTDEPGIYREGEYGIRTESELLCHKGTQNAFGQFMYFENLTYVPIDLDALLPEQMTDVERQRLNEYHAMVFEKVAPLLEEKEAEWLRNYTRPI